jgi:hypothetical protein
MEYDRKDLNVIEVSYYDSNDPSNLRVTIYDTTRCHINSKGILHNLLGPAVIHLDGEELWYINGYDVTIKIWDWAKDRNIDLTNLSDFDKDVIKLEWASYDGQKQ